MDDVQWLTERQQRAWRGFMTMWRRLESAINRQLLEESALSAADYELLVPLSEAPGQRLRARDLARSVDWEKSRLSHQIRRMEQRGLVKREDCPTDARGSFVCLTEAGLQAIEGAAPGHVRTVRRLFIDLLQPEELDTLTAICDRALDRLDRDGYGASSSSFSGARSANAIQT